MPDPHVPSRHARQEALAEVGAAGQERIRRSRVLVVGLGGLGAPAALYLAGAGVGRIGLCDFDVVDVTNLHRQPLYALADVGRRKTDAARDRLRALDGALDLVTISARAGHAGEASGGAGPADVDAHALVQGWDVVLDCTDDLQARYGLADACLQAGIPLVQGAVAQWDGTCTVFAPGGPCYRCLHPAPPFGAGTCATDGVLGTVPGVIGVLQAQEALKLVLGVGDPLVGRLLLFDARAGATRTVSLKRRDGCICSMDPVDRPAEDGRGRMDGNAATPDRRGDMQESLLSGSPAACPLPWAAPDVTALTAQEYEEHKGDFFLLDVREPYEFEEVHMPNANLVPLGSLRARMGELPKDRPIVCVCAVGGRSAHATEYLRAQGYTALNLRGGIRAWLMTQR